MKEILKQIAGLERKNMWETKRKKLEGFSIYYN